MAEIFTVETRGVGKPDYTREVSSAKERSGIALKENQRFRVFSGDWGIAEPLYPLIVDGAIPIGGQRHLIDSDTAVPLPTTILAGYTLSIISVAITSTEDIELYAFFDSIGCVPMGGTNGGVPMYENKIREFSTVWYDPAAVLPHDLDIIAYNRGGGALHGGVGLLCIEEAVGTPPWSTTKDCMCPHCNHKQTEPISATGITCQECGKEYIVTNFASLRQLGG